MKGLPGVYTRGLRRSLGYYVFWASSPIRELMVMDRSISLISKRNWRAGISALHSLWTGPNALSTRSKWSTGCIPEYVATSLTAKIQMILRGNPRTNELRVYILWDSVQSFNLICNQTCSLNVFTNLYSGEAGLHFFSITGPPRLLFDHINFILKEKMKKLTKE